MKLPRFNLFVIITVVIVTAVLLWSANTRITEFASYHQSIAEASIAKAAADISDLIHEKKRQVNLFIQKQQAQIQELIAQPDNFTIYTHLKNEIIEYFPHAYSFILTNDKGVAVNRSSQQNMGPSCASDIYDFARTGFQSVRIHPADIHHIDIMQNIQIEDKTYIFVINFNTSSLTHSLTHIETPGHRLLLTLPNANNLIELTDLGSRDKLAANEHHLSADQLHRVLSSAAIPDTSWEVVDIHNTSLFSDYNQSVFYQTNLAILLLIATMILMIYLNHLEVKKRMKAERSKDEFLSIVSHELRTPLTAINGSLSLMANGLTGVLPEKTSRTLDIAISNTYRLSHLVNDLLDVQSLETGHMNFVKVLTEPSVFINRVVENMRDYIVQNNCEYTTVIKACNKRIFIDPDRMEQVIINLISNAVKYGRHDDRIEIKMSCNPSHVVFTVTDHGAGINEDNQEFVFGKFTQSSMKDNRKNSGNGLGLYISRMIVSSHDGKIGFTSIPHRRTTFFVKLPLVD